MRPSSLDDYATKHSETQSSFILLWQAIQVYLGDSVCLAPDHVNKASIAIKRVK